MMKDDDLKYFAFEFYISIFDGLKVIRVQKYQKNPKNGFFWGSLFWCQRSHRIFIFRIVKELDHNLIILSYKLLTLLVPKIQASQKNKKIQKSGFFGGPFFWCQRGSRIFIFGIVKELDPNFNDIKLQTPNFIGTKVIDFQKNKKIQKSGFFGGPFFGVKGVTES